MVEDQVSPSPLAIDPDALLEGDEVIIIVDDDKDLLFLLQNFLTNQGLPVIAVQTATELKDKIQDCHAALILLDIGLPDSDGAALLPWLKKDYPDTSVLMLTAVTDLQTALTCLRGGADDYLSKPIHLPDFLSVLRGSLAKRRLVLQSRQYQRQLEQANYRISLSHTLAMKMNSAYLSMTALNEILLAILVGITAEEGLGFNRAFLALFDDSGEHLEGRLAIGPGTREEGGRIWQDLYQKDLGLYEIFASIQRNETTVDAEVNRIVRALRVDAVNTEHLLIRAIRERKSIVVQKGKAVYPVPEELIALLQEDSFVVVPLYAPNRAQGVIIADYFVSRRLIDKDCVYALESFAGQASLAIEHCRLHTGMQHKIREIELATQELEKNKDLLIEAERYSAFGHMAAHLAHSIRNPITAIGGTARMLTHKVIDKSLVPFLNMMASEAEKIEKILTDLCDFAEQAKPVFEETHLLPIIHNSLLLYLNVLKHQGIQQKLVFPEHDPLVRVDPHLIQQALVHLLRNCVEAMPDGGELSVEVVLEEKQVQIILGDSGGGLSEAHRQQAIEPFYTTKMAGIGIGLTLVKRIVRDHGGSLRLENRHEGGTSVTIVLPRLVEG